MLGDNTQNPMFLLPEYVADTESIGRTTSIDTTTITKKKDGFNNDDDDDGTIDEPQRHQRLQTTITTTTTTRTDKATIQTNRTNGSSLSLTKTSTKRSLTALGTRTITTNHPTTTTTSMTPGTTTRVSTSLSRATSRQQRSHYPEDASTESHGHEWYVALSEGRGVSGEIGLVALDKKTSQCKMAQYSDSPAFHLTLHKLSMISPVEIIFADSSVHPVPTKLYQAVMEYIGDSLSTEIVTGPRRDFNDKQGLESLEQYGVQGTMNQFDTDFCSKYYCLCAVSALFSHLEKNHRIGFIRQSIKFEYEQPGACMVIDSVTRKNLELVRSIDGRANKSDMSLFKVLNKTSTSMGARLLRKTILQPHFDLDIIERKLDSVQELLGNPKMAVRLEEMLKNMLDVDHLISSLIQIPLEQTAKSAEQTVNNLVLLKHILHYSEVVLEDLSDAQSLLLVEIREILEKCKSSGLMEDISTYITESTRYEKKPLGLRNQRAFSIKQGVHGLLDVARQTYREAMEDAYGMVEEYSQLYGLALKCEFLPGVGFLLALPLKDLQESGKVLDDEAAGSHGTMGRNVRSKGNPKKVQMDQRRGTQGGSGSHHDWKNILPEVFINVTQKKKHLQFTTLRLKSQNERIQEALTEIYLISDKISSELLDRMREQVGVLYELSEALAMLDLLVSFASYSSTTLTVRPEFTKTLAIKNGRHPILEKILLSDSTTTTTAIRRGGGRSGFTPNDSYADSRSHLQILTGPNTSGKTTYLKQMGLLILMAHMGCYVPAEYMSLPFVDAIFSRMGNDDCLEANASSFMVEMMETCFLLANATRKSLVLIDELGRGTCTRDGIGISVAVCEALLQRKCFVYVVTHFQELAMTMQCYSGCVLLQMDTKISNEENTSTDLQEQQQKTTLTFTYSVRNGICTHENYGVYIAERAGLPRGILERARHVSTELKEKAKKLQQQQQTTTESTTNSASSLALFRKRHELLSSICHIHLHSKLDSSSLKRLYMDLQEKVKEMVL